MPQVVTGSGLTPVTFQIIYDRLNRHAGLTLFKGTGRTPLTPGDLFINWCQGVGQKRGYGEVDLSSTTYGPFSALEWLEAYATYVFGHQLGAVIAGGISISGQDMLKQAGIVSKVLGQLRKNPIVQVGGKAEQTLGNLGVPGFAQTGQGPFGGLSSLNDLMGRLTQQSTWIRVGEVAGGLLLLYVGVKAIIK